MIPVTVQSLYDTMNQHHHFGKISVNLKWTAVTVGGVTEEVRKSSICLC